MNRDFPKMARALLVANLDAKRLARRLRQLHREGCSQGFNDGAKWMMKAICERAATFAHANRGASVADVLAEVTKLWR